MSSITNSLKVTTMSKRCLNNGAMSKNRGFTLMEALIGFLILSIGMLGIASLQAISLKAGKTSVYGSVAMMKVEELFESMRANTGALASYAGTGVGANKSCSTNDCDEAALAADDLFWWSQNLKAGLPGAATASVVVVAPAPAPAGASKMATVTIGVSWDERNKEGSGSVSKTYTTTANICTGTPC